MKRVMFLAVAALLFFIGVPKFSKASVPATAAQEQAAPAPNAKTFTGTVIKDGTRFVLSDAANKLSFILDGSDKVNEYEGKKVKVTGTVNVATNTIHVDTIEAIA